MFFKGDIGSVNRVTEALNHFSNATRLMANLDKSNIFFCRGRRVDGDP